MYLNHFAAGTAAANPATVQGVATKTAISLALAIAGGIGGTALVKAGGQGALMGIWIASMVASLGAFFVTYRNPARAAWATPIYSVLQGAFLGSFALGIAAFGDPDRYGLAHISLQPLTVLGAMPTAVLIASPVFLAAVVAASPASL